MTWVRAEENAHEVSKPNEVVAQQTVQPEIRSTSILDQLSGEKSGEFLNKMINQAPAERVVAGAVAGPMAMVAAQNDMEDAVPSALGVAGGYLGAMLGHPNVGAGFGYGVGDVGKQLIEKAKGETDSVNVGSSFLKGAGAGLLSKGVESILKIGGQSLNLIPEAKRVAFYNQVARAADVGHKKLVSNYGKAVEKITAENPTVRVNAREAVEKVRDVANGVSQDIIPQIKTALKRNPRLKNVIDNPDEAIGLTLKESMELLQTIKGTSKSIIDRVSGGKSALPSERGLFDVLDTFQSSIVKAFPQMRGINEIYKAGKDAYKLARPLLNPGSTVESSIMSSPQGLFGLGGSKFMQSTGGKLALKDIASQTKAGEKLYNSALLSHNLNRAADAVGRWAEIGAGAMLAKQTWGRLKEGDE